MKTQILLIAMISISFQALTATTDCACSDYAATDCTNRGCVWTAADSTCADKTIDCTTYTTQATCDEVSKCAYTDSTSKCADFTKCEDYTVATAELCPAKNANCVAGTAGTDGKFPCKTQAATTITCSSFKSAAECNMKSPADNAVCWFKGSACEQIDVSKCSTISVQDLCELMCKWADNKCAAQTCADLKTADDCDYVHLDDFSGVNLCTWGTACADAADVKALTKDTCNSKTADHYYWDGTACTECSGSSSNSYILAFIGFIVMLMF